MREERCICQGEGKMRGIFIACLMVLASVVLISSPAMAMTVSACNLATGELWTEPFFGQPPTAADLANLGVYVHYMDSDTFGCVPVYPDINSPLSNPTTIFLDNDYSYVDAVSNNALPAPRSMASNYIDKLCSIGSSLSVQEFDISPPVPGPRGPPDYVYMVYVNIPDGEGMYTSDGTCATSGHYSFSGGWQHNTGDGGIANDRYNDLGAIAVNKYYDGDTIGGLPCYSDVQTRVAQVLAGTNIMLPDGRTQWVNGVMKCNSCRQADFTDWYTVTEHQIQRCCKDIEDPSCNTATINKVTGKPGAYCAWQITEPTTPSTTDNPMLVPTGYIPAMHCFGDETGSTSKIVAMEDNSYCSPDPNWDSRRYFGFEKPSPTTEAVIKGWWARTGCTSCGLGGMYSCYTHSPELFITGSSVGVNRQPSIEDQRNCLDLSKPKLSEVTKMGDNGRIVALFDDGLNGIANSPSSKSLLNSKVALIDKADDTKATCSAFYSDMPTT